MTLAFAETRPPGSSHADALPPAAALCALVEPGTPGPPLSVGIMDDPSLIACAVECQVAENAARARRLAAMSEFHTRRVAEGGDRSPAAPSFFVLTPLQCTASEFSGALVVTDTTIEINLDLVTRLQTWFPAVWARCLSGRLDLGRASVWLDAVAKFADEDDIAAFARSMEAYVDKYDDTSSPLCTLTRSQLQRAARYRKMKFKQQTEQESFAAAFQRRRLSFRPGEDGMGSLAVRGMVTDAMAADYRITLIAKKLQEAPDETRTLDQLRADITIDLMLGRLTVTATTGQLEHDEDDLDPGAVIDGWDSELDDLPDDVHGDRRWLRTHAVGAFARPVVNVTVPIQTLMGVSDEPGVLSGGIPVPSDLARIIAQDPSSTWYRMLTAERRQCVELSTHSYEPTKPITNQVVARDQTCMWPTCSRPAVRCELDHRKEWPDGETSTDNLGPLCKRHHKVKHSPGFAIVKNPDGSHTWTTRYGQSFTTLPREQPLAEWPEAASRRVQRQPWVRRTSPKASSTAPANSAIELNSRL